MIDRECSHSRRTQRGRELQKANPVAVYAGKAPVRRNPEPVLRATSKTRDRAAG